MCVSASLTSDTFEILLSPSCSRNWSYVLFIVITKCIVSVQTCSKFRTKGSFSVTFLFLCDCIIASLKGQSSSFHPARCLLTLTERTECLGMCLFGLLVLFFSNLFCIPIRCVMKMLCASETGFSLLGRIAEIIKDGLYEETLN